MFIYHLQNYCFEETNVFVIPVYNWIFYFLFISQYHSIFKALYFIVIVNGTEWSFSEVS